MGSGEWVGLVVPAAAVLPMGTVEVLGELRRHQEGESGAAGLLQVLGGRRRRLKVEGGKGESVENGRGGRGGGGGMPALSEVSGRTKNTGAPSTTRPTG